MTVAIGAICNIGANRPPCVVAACDRMVTIRGLQYEPHQRKTVELATTTVALFAGEMQLHAAVTPKTSERLKALTGERDQPRLTVQEIAEIYAEEFGYYRRNLAEREVLVPRGLNFANLPRQLSGWPHYQVRELDAMLAAHSVDSTAIIVGIDHLGAHIYVVRDPGVAASYAIPCFACAGSGKDIAEAQFMVAQYDKQWPLSKALWLAYSAKARAQVAGGVGPETDLIVIAPGRIDYATDAQTKYLFEMFKHARAKENDAQNEAVSVLEVNLAMGAAKSQDQSADQNVPQAGGIDLNGGGDLAQQQAEEGGSTEDDPPTSS